MRTNVCLGKQVKFKIQDKIAIEYLQTFIEIIVKNVRKPHNLFTWVHPEYAIAIRYMRLRGEKNQHNKCTALTPLLVYKHKSCYEIGKKIRRCNKIDFLKKEEEKTEITQHKENDKGIYKINRRDSQNLCS